MLQQTQVATVVPYFERFLSRFPTLGDLAAATLPEVLAQWSGLGYYTRARNLHRAAQVLARSGFPRTAQGLRELPGFGPYTAAAVASIAFSDPVPLVDGNVARVLARLRAIAGPPGAPGRERRLWDEAGVLLDRESPGTFNEAMMELGALVCTPSDPRCGACPFTRTCLARQRDLVASIPAPKVRPRRGHLALACAVVLREGAILLARRQERGLFGGLWELPTARTKKGLSAARALARLGLEPIDRRAFATVRRTLTHRDLSLQLLRCSPPRQALPGYLEQRLVPRAEIPSLGVASAMAAALERCAEG